MTTQSESPPEANAEPGRTHADDHPAAAVGHDGGGSGHGDDDGEPLGPIDWRAWGAAVVGIVAALVTAGALAVAGST
jgi:hypothetical protein